VSEKDEGWFPMQDDLQRFLTTALQSDREELPRLLGELETARYTLLQRLTAPAPLQSPGPDELVDVETAAKRLNVTKDHLYRHSGDYPFTVRIANKVRFSALGIDEWVREQRGAGNSNINRNGFGDRRKFVTTEQPAIARRR
jgi:hypothetical protein